MDGKPICDELPMNEAITVFRDAKIDGDFLLLKLISTTDSVEKRAKNKPASAPSVQPSAEETNETRSNKSRKQK